MIIAATTGLTVDSTTPKVLRATAVQNFIRSPKRSPTGSRRGLSLIEVVFAITILGMSLAVIGQLFQLGMRSGRKAEILSQAYVLCDSKMAEIASGLLPLEATSGSAIPENPLWRYSVSIEPSNQIGLLIVEVEVEQVNDNPISFSVVRFMPDPDFAAELERLAEQNK